MGAGVKEKLVKLLKEDGLTLALVLALAITYFALRTSGDTFASADELESELAGGRPTVVEFYSNTCSICLASKPKVDRLERDIQSQASLLRLNVKEDAGLALAYRWQVSGVPTFFVFNGSGDAVYRRAGAPDTAAIKAAVVAALESND
jgi:thiol-disulfide isomerase/thioredoxin